MVSLKMYRQLFLPSSISFRENYKTNKRRTVFWSDLFNYLLPIKYMSMSYVRQLKGPSRYRIESMDIVDNARMKEDFERKKTTFREKGIPAEPFYAYHGTKKSVIGTILSSTLTIITPN